MNNQNKAEQIEAVCSAVLDQKKPPEIDPKDIPTKAELIEAVCMAVLKKEKANPKHAEIVVTRKEVLVKIKKKVLGRVVETNGTFNFQYLIS